MVGKVFLAMVIICLEFVPVAQFDRRAVMEDE